MTGIEVAPGVFIEEGEMYFAAMGKWKRFWHEFKWGWHYKYPLCCVIRFALHDARRDGQILPTSEGQFRKRGAVRLDDGECYVPCCIFHSPTERHEDRYAQGV